MFEDIKSALAQQDYQTALTLISKYKPDSTYAGDELAILEGAVYESLHDLDQLFSCIQRGLSINGQNYELYFMLGNYYYELKEFARSYLCYEQSEFYCTNDDITYIRELKQSVAQKHSLCVPPVSIVILSYNTKDLMQLCIKSIRATLSPGTYEIIVVDNASTDGITDWLREQSDIKLICNPTNNGFPMGCNQGIELAAPGNDIFLLNNDTILPPNALFYLRMGLYSSPSVGAAGSVTNYASNGQKITIPNPSPEAYLKLASSINVPEKNPYISKTWLVGFALLIKHSALKEVGTLDISFSPGNYEDYDYGLRLEQAGYERILCQNSFILHWGSQNFSKDLSTWSSVLSRNKKLLADKWNHHSKQILLVTHQLSRTGAPGALYDLAVLLQKLGYTIDLISLKDGPLRTEYEKLGISSIILPDLMDNYEQMTALLGIYDFIVSNTLACAPLINFLCHTQQKCFWWIHENELLFQQIATYLASMQLTKNIIVLAAGKYVQQLVTNYLHYPSEILNICIPDAYCPSTFTDHKTIRFAQIGLIDGTKGQEIFLGAILNLPEEIRNQCEFFICGDRNTANPDVLKLITSSCVLFPCIHYMDSMDRNTLYHFYDSIDCLVVPSRIESMSAVMIEGFMKEKICICTDHTGISAYMKNGINGYIFKTNDIEQLCQIIQHIVKNYASMESIKKEGRRIYDTLFSEQHFETTVKELLNKFV